MAKKKKKPASKKRKKGPKQAELADRHDLYQRSVQNPEPEVYFMNRIFRRYRKRKPMSMKEDFCGTAYLSSEWVASHRERTAIGVDLDRATLAWGREHNVARLKKSQRARIQLVEANVLDLTEPKVDIVNAFNFSYCVFKQRHQLIQYFKTAYASLVPDGVFFCELYGGTEAIVELEEARELPGFTYLWNQAKFNPITRETLCHIHFEFPDGSRLDEAFTYDWRLWTIPELRECLIEAGFKKVFVYWDPVEGDEKGDDWYRVTEEEENQEGWLVYLVALK